MAGALQALREATQDSHSALEASALSTRMMSSAVTLDNYRSFLVAQLAVFAPWCEAYPQTLRRGCRCDPVARLDALHLDLSELQYGVLDAPSLGTFDFDWPDEAPEWWGALYVFEGSRLGGRVVARHLRQQLGACVDAALRFLDPPNDATQPAWPSLSQSIERALPRSSRAAAIGGARRAFAHFDRAFARAWAPCITPGSRAVAA